jgi:RHS repeat-associated protein
VAEMDGAGNLVARFVGTHYFVRGGTTYRMITDQRGSPRVLVDVGTGTIAQRLDYDEYGRVLADSAPGFQPFGFAGGIYDPDTGLVRFGARDYDADTGRWTAKDPIDFKSGELHLYAYVGNDPINRVDRSGLTSLEFDMAAHKLIIDPEQPLDRAPYWVSAESGKGACMNDIKCGKIKMEGPLEKGNYHLRPNPQIDKPPPKGADWGMWRVRIIPDFKTSRTRLYLHGGETPGTSGCLQINNKDDMKRVKEDLKADPDNLVPLKVK